jgi:hypothetical protein
MLNSDKHNCNNINECDCFDSSSRFFAQHSDVCAEFMDRQCSEDCRDTSGDFQCKCKKGHWLQEDGFTCADVDECRCMNDQTYKVSETHKLASLSKLFLGAAQEIGLEHVQQSRQVSPQMQQC